MSTLKGIGPGGWNKHNLANSQGQAGKVFPPVKDAPVAYRLFTEDSDSTRESLLRLVTRYFEGATITYTTGLWQGQTERGAVVDIIGTSDDVQAVVNLAGDIRFVHGQAAVLVTWHNVSQLLVTGL